METALTVIARAMEDFWTRTSPEVSLPVLVCRLRFQTGLNLNWRQKFIQPTPALWFWGPAFLCTPAAPAHRWGFQLPWAEEVPWDALNAFYSDLRAPLIVPFLPCKGTNSFWVCWMWSPKLDNGSWCERVPKARRDPQHTSFPPSGELNLEFFFFFWVLLGEHIVLVLTWSYYNCNKILNDFRAADFMVLKLPQWILLCNDIMFFLNKIQTF